MGGLPCAKQIIDNYFALVQAGGCMSTSILLAAVNHGSPTQDQADRFAKAANALAEIMAEIEKSVRDGAPY